MNIKRNRDRMHKRILLVAASAVLFFGACQKYEEGPAISFRSPEKRLYGTYHITEYSVNGTDSLALLNDSLGNVLSIYYNEVEAKDAAGFTGTRNVGGSSYVYFQWHLSDDALDLIIDQTTGLTGGTGPFTPGSLPVWRILKLKAKKIRMETTVNGKSYLLGLVDDF